MTLLLMISFALSSCNAPKIKPLILCDASIKFDRCRCRCYNLNESKSVENEKCGLNSKRYVLKDVDLMTDDEISDVWGLLDNEKAEIGINFPIERCDQIAGFSLNDWAINIDPWQKEIRQFYKDECSK